VRVSLCVVLLAIVPSIARADASDYAYTTKRAHYEVREYCRLDCHRATRGLPCCDTFDKAMRGDFSALTLVFTDSDYQSGDNESWDFTAWPLLHVVGDQRFAAWLRTLDVPTQNRVFDHIFYAGSYYPRAIKAGYFRRKFPQVEAIYHTLHRNDYT
jgi:hypothetical protein